MGTLGALLIGKPPWLAAPGWAGRADRGRGALATRSLSKQPEQTLGGGGWIPAEALTQGERWHISAGPGKRVAPSVPGAQPATP